jgi:uncharacterized membrane protein YbaN (DUF454 family)
MVEPIAEREPPQVATGLRRWLLFVAGFLCLGLGGIGVILPGLPTTPFVLLAAYFFARSSPTMHERLLSNKVFGPMILEWNQHRSVPLRAKILAVTMIALVGGALVIFILDKLWLRLIVIATLSTVSIWLITRPTSPSERVEEHRRRHQR